jgi:hypothetical protein
MESLPAPSELVEDEWAAMRIRFQREGLQYGSLSADQRLLQVQRQCHASSGRDYNMTASVRIRGCSRYRGNATVIKGGAPIWQPQCGSEAAPGTEAMPRFQREGLQYDSLSADQRLLQVQRQCHASSGRDYNMTASVRIRGCSRYRGNATVIKGGAPIWQPQCGSEAATGTEATPRLQREGLQCDSLSVDQRLLQVQRLHHDLLPYNSLCVDQRLLQVQRLRHDSGGRDCS